MARHNARVSRFYEIDILEEPTLEKEVCINDLSSLPPDVGRAIWNFMAEAYPIFAPHHYRKTNADISSGLKVFVIGSAYIFSF
jgi:hypothetical protein